MWDGVMDEFSRRQEFGPIMGLIGTKDPQIGLDFLIGSFSLTVGLRMVSGREADIIV
jgi:hypothetical protein